MSFGYRILGFGSGAGKNTYNVQYLVVAGGGGGKTSEDTSESSSTSSKGSITESFRSSPLFNILRIRKLDESINA